MKSINKKQFSFGLLVWSILFFSFGQILFGCASMKTAQEQWGATSVATIQEQGKTDREFLRLQSRCGGDCEEKEPPTTVSAPASLNIPKKITVIPEHTRFTLEEGETIIPETTTEETDHAALSILVMGEALKIIAETVGKNSSLKANDDYSQQQKRIVYKAPRQPEVDTVSGIIRETGSAVQKQSWIARIFEAWFVVDGFREIAKAPNLVTENSNNPVTTTNKTTTTTTTTGAH